MPDVLMENCFALLILIVWDVVFRFFNFSRHDLGRTLLFNDKRIDICSTFNLLFNELDLILKRLVFVFKILHIVKLLLVSFFDGLELKLVCLDVRFELDHFILISLLVFKRLLHWVEYFSFFFTEFRDCVSHIDDFFCLLEDLLKKKKKGFS